METDVSLTLSISSIFYMKDKQIRQSIMVAMISSSLLSKFYQYNISLLCCQYINKKLCLILCFVNVISNHKFLHSFVNIISHFIYFGEELQLLSSHVSKSMISWIFIMIIIIILMLSM